MMTCLGVMSVVIVLCPWHRARPIVALSLLQLLLFELAVMIGLDHLLKRFLTEFHCLFHLLVDLVPDFSINAGFDGVDLLRMQLGHHQRFDILGLTHSLGPACLNLSLDYLALVSLALLHLIDKEVIELQIGRVKTVSAMPPLQSNQLLRVIRLLQLS